jgi:PAS domain S-box-containing protein
MIISDSVVIRGVIIGMLIVPSFLAAALIAIQSRQPETRSLRYSFAMAFLVTASLWTVLIIRAIIIPGDYSLGGPDPINPFFFIVTILMDVVGTCSFLMLNMARTKIELRRSEERYRNLTDNLPDYVIVHDGEIILYANMAAIRLMAPSQKTLDGRSIYSFLTPESTQASRSVLAAYCNGESPSSLNEIDIRLNDHTVRHCMVKTVRIEYKGAPAFLAVITDITERKAAEDALSRVNRKLTILSSITRHDIKNQLMALSTYLELSKEEIDPDSAASEYLKRETKIAQTMGYQIDFTKIYEEMGTASPVWQNVNASIQRAVASLPLRGIRIEIDRSDVEIYADSLFEKVFYNLIDNALKYGGEAMTTIRITANETGTGLLIACEDDGVGIPDEEKQYVFDKGYGKNSGLGLFLTREILSITGIGISESGEPGKGARFGLVVPKGAYRFAENNTPTKV